MATSKQAAALGPMSAYENLTNAEFIDMLDRALMYAEIEEG